MENVAGFGIILKYMKLRDDDIINLEYEPTIEELEFYEKVEEGTCKIHYVITLFKFGLLFIDL